MIKLKEKNEVREKSIGIELLRIFSMLMIITLHFLNHGEVLDTVNLFSVNGVIVWLIEAFCYVSVNCYVIISGYFLIEAKFKFKKVLKLILQVLQYSIMIYLILLVNGKIAFNLKEALKSLLPVLSRKYWFATTYIGLYFLFPFLNIGIKALTKKQMQLLIVTVIGLFSIWPVFIPFSLALNSGGGYGVVWFICLYIVAAYIRLNHSVTKTLLKRRYLLVYLVGSIALVVSKYAITLIISCNKSLVGLSSLLYQYNSIIVLLMSVSLFMFFNNLKIVKCDRLIVAISRLTFGIYLFHDNSDLREIIWGAIIRPYIYVSEQWFIAYMLLSIVAIFALGSLIELFRQKLLGKVENKIGNNLELKIAKFRDILFKVK